MKKVIVLAIGLTGLVFSSNAQETGTQPQHSTHHRQKFTHKNLNLTEAQKEQLKAHRQSSRAQLAELEKNENLTVKEYKARKAEIRKSQKEQMDQLLTEEQKLALSNAGMNREGRSSEHHRFNMDKMKSSLNLSEEQVSKLKQHQNKRKIEIQAIKGDKQLTAEERKERMKEIKVESKTLYKEILTPAQFEKMQLMKKEKVRKQK